MIYDWIEMMNVMLVASVASMHENFNQNNILLLKQLGCVVHLAANFNVNQTISETRLIKFKEFCSREDVVIHHLDVGRSPYQLIRLIRGYFQLKTIAKSSHIQLIHSHSPVGGLLSRLVSRTLNIKNLYSAHGFHFFKGSSLLSWITYYRIERWLSKFTDGLIVMNQEDLEIAKNSFDCDTYLIPGVGITLNSKTKTIKQNHDVLQLVSIGELNKNKNHESVIRALDSLDIPYHYSIVGSGNRFKVLNKIIQSLKLENKISLKGYQDNVYSILLHSEIYIHPSRREGLPVSVMEAMLAGLPVIASDIRGNRDLVDHGFGGYLYPLDEPERLLEFLIDLYRYPEKIKSFGRHNIEKINQYSIQKVNAQMENIYRGLIRELK